MLCSLHAKQSFFKDVQPWHSPSNLYSSFEDGTSGVSVPEGAGFFMIVDGIHGCPIFMAGSQIAGTHTRG